MLPRASTGSVAYDGAIFCRALGFATYSEVENSNYQGGCYVLSESARHRLVFSGFFEDDLTEARSDGGEPTYLETLARITPRARALYTFELDLFHDDADAAARFLELRIEMIDLVSADSLDPDNEGRRRAITVRHRDAG